MSLLSHRLISCHLLGFIRGNLAKHNSMRVPELVLGLMIDPWRIWHRTASEPSRDGLKGGRLWSRTGTCGDKGAYFGYLFSFMPMQVHLHLVIASYLTIPAEGHTSDE
jgi:hypothetical protein